MKTRLLVAILVLVGFGTAAQAETIFLGQTVRLTYYEDDVQIANTPWVDYASQAVVGPGVEFPGVLSCIGGGSCLDVDLSDANILATMHYDDATGNYGGFTPWAFNGIWIYDLNGAIPAFTSVTINGLTNMAGFNASRIAFDSDNIWVNLQGLSGHLDTVVSLDVGSAVPEPASLLLLGTGLVGLTRWRKRRT